MPYLHSLESEKEKSMYLTNLFQETYLKEIVAKNNIQNNHVILEFLLDFISFTVGSLTNLSKLAYLFVEQKQIKLSSNIVAKYIYLFNQSYLLYQVKRYDIKEARYCSTPLKYYFADVGLRNARLNFSEVEQSQLMENIIYNELLRRGFAVDVGLVEYDCRKGGGRKKLQLEVDFVVNKGSQRFYFQAALNVDSLER